MQTMIKKKNQLNNRKEKNENHEKTLKVMKI